MTSPTVDRRFGLVGNIAMKAPITVASDSNITLSGQQTIDGVAVLALNAASVPDRVLCTGQTDSSQNGIWDVSTSAWTRSLDANGSYDLAQGSMVVVTRGTAYAGSIWQLTSSNPITIGTTNTTWARTLGQLQVDSYTTLRAYTGGASSFSVTGYSSSVAPSGTAGVFTRDPTDTTSADNGGTIIVDTSGRRWKRQFTGAVNVRWFGADNTGVSNATTAFATAIATGSEVFVPKGTYLIATENTLILNSNQRLFGEGWQSILRFTGTERCITVGDRSRVSNLKIQGDGAGAGKAFQTGVFCFQKNGWQIEDCWFLDLSGTAGTNGGGGVYGSSVGGTTAEGGLVRGCRFSGCNGGVVLPSQAQYVTVSDCTMIGNTTGYLSSSGNNVLANCRIQLNTTGVSIGAGTNDSHGAISNCLVNHNTTNLLVGAITNGMSINGSFFYVGAITMTSSLGVRMVNCDLSAGTLTLNGGMDLQISHSRFPLSPDSDAMSQVLNGGSTITSISNLNF